VTLLDWALLAVWLGVTLSGFWEGAVRLVFGGGGLIAGLWLALAVGGEVAVRVEAVAGVAWLAAVLGRLLPFIACVVVALAAGWGIERTLKALHLGWLNRLCGAGLAGVIGGVLLAVFLTTAVRLSPSWRSWAEHSLLAPRLLHLWSAAEEGRGVPRDTAEPQR
jgi:uncharacterized membrane protein required for colicin V production